MAGASEPVDGSTKQRRIAELARQSPEMGFTSLVKRKTSKSRLRRGFAAVAQWCRTNRHQLLAFQQHTLSQKLRGHVAYYGITGNGHTLSEFQSGVVELWRKWLGRRHRGGEVTWERMHRLLERYPLPKASVVHSVYR